MAVVTTEPRSLYGADTLADLQPGATVYVVESITEVKAGQAAGLPVVSAPLSGGGGWYPEYNEQLARLTVVCVPSTGLPNVYGRPKWAGIVRQIVKSAAAVRMLALTDGDGTPVIDLASYLQDHSPAEFVELAEAKATELRPAKGKWESAQADDGEGTLANGPAWPHPMAEQAFYGLSGDVVRTIEPTTEGDPVALLLNFHGYFGNCAGLKPIYRVEDTDHGLNEFVGIVGATSKSRKGTADRRIRRLFQLASAEWTSRRVKSGLSSGEGLIWQVRDPIFNADGEVEDPGDADKRLLIVESELATVLRRIEREGSSLSPLMRDAWDRSHSLEALVSERNRPAVRAAIHHISVIGHITKAELARYLTRTEAANGLGNRFIWGCVKRARLLPRGAASPNLDELVRRLHQALEFANSLDKPLDFDKQAGAAWETVYGPLSEGKPGLLGAMIARGEAHVVRLATMYAVLDLRPVIGLPHLLAALAVWDYSEASAQYIFGEELGDPDADAVLQALRQSPTGLAREELRDHFSRNWPAARIRQSLLPLLDLGLVEEVPATGKGKGRPATRYRALPTVGTVAGQSYLSIALGAGGNAVNDPNAGNGDLNQDERGVPSQEGYAESDAVIPGPPTQVGDTAYLPRTYHVRASSDSELVDGITASTAFTASELLQTDGKSPEVLTPTELPPLGPASEPDAAREGQDI